MSCGSWIIEPGVLAFDEDLLSLAPCDMRKEFDELSAQVRNILQLDPFLCVGRDYVAAASIEALFA